MDEEQPSYRHHNESGSKQTLIMVTIILTLIFVIII